MVNPGGEVDGKCGNSVCWSPANVMFQRWVGLSIVGLCEEGLKPLAAASRIWGWVGEVGWIRIFTVQFLFKLNGG